MIAAGVNAKALSQYMGHSSITVTLDRYGHLMPGSEDEGGDQSGTACHESRAVRPIIPLRETPAVKAGKANPPTCENGGVAVRWL